MPTWLGGCETWYIYMAMAAMRKLGVLTTKPWGL